jgi:hypothetical protein
MVNGNSTVNLVGYFVPVGAALIGRRVTIRLDGELMPSSPMECWPAPCAARYQPSSAAGADRPLQKRSRKRRADAKRRAVTVRPRNATVVASA